MYQNAGMGLQPAHPTFCLDLTRSDLRHSRVSGLSASGHPSLDRARQGLSIALLIIGFG